MPPLAASWGTLVGTPKSGAAALHGVGATGGIGFEGLVRTPVTLSARGIFGHPGWGIMPTVPDALAPREFSVYFEAGVLVATPQIRTLLDRVAGPQGYQVHRGTGEIHAISFRDLERVVAEIRRPAAEGGLGIEVALPDDAQAEAISGAKREMGGPAFEFFPAAWESQPLLSERRESRIGYGWFNHGITSGGIERDERRHDTGVILVRETLATAQATLDAQVTVFADLLDGTAESVRQKMLEAVRLLFEGRGRFNTPRIATLMRFLFFTFRHITADALETLCQLRREGYAGEEVVTPLNPLVKIKAKWGTLLTPRVITNAIPKLAHAGFQRAEILALLDSIGDKNTANFSAAVEIAAELKRRGASQEEIDHQLDQLTDHGFDTDNGPLFWSLDVAHLLLKQGYEVAQALTFLQIPQGSNYLRQEAWLLAYHLLRTEVDPQIIKAALVSIMQSPLVLSAKETLLKTLEQQTLSAAGKNLAQIQALTSPAVLNALAASTSPFETNMNIGLALAVAGMTAGQITAALISLSAIWQS